MNRSELTPVVFIGLLYSGADGLYVSQEKYAEQHGVDSPDLHAGTVLFEA